MDKILYNLTSPQKAIWLTEQYYKNTNINNVCGVFEASTKLDFQILEKAIKQFVKNNESYRTRLTLENGEIKQYFSEFSDFPIETVLVNSEKERIELEEKENSKGFDLLNSRLFKFTLFKYPNGSGGYIINSSHIISDSWTSGLLVNEITKIYNTLKNLNNISKNDDLSYSNYIKSEKDYLESEKFIKDKNYWNTVFETIPEEVATIPYDKNISNNDLSYKAKRYLTNIDSKLFEKLKKYAQKNKVSLYNLLIGIFSIYISRVSRLNDFVIGAPILNRTNFKEKLTAGMFINVLPLRIQVDSQDSFKDFTSKIATNSMGLLRHQKYSYNNIIEDLRKKDSSIPSLYNIIMSYQITKMTDDNDILPHKTSWTFNGSILNDLEFHFFEWNDINTLQFAYDYKVNKYTGKEIINIHNRILNIINQILDNENILLKDIEIVTNEEKNKILYEFNNTKTDYPSDKTISELFEEQALKTPNKTALVFENKSLTYKELNEKSNQLARFLIEKGIQKNDIVSIYLDKSLETIISILGILKSGCTYMPIDIDYPSERIDYMIKTSNSKYILTSKLFKDRLKKYDNVIDINLENKNIYNLNHNNIEIKSSSNDLAYIMFTSGSTGEPKGVMVTNKNVVRLIKNNKFIKFEKNEHILQTGSIVFDACTFEIWGALLKGFTLYIIKKLDLLDPIILSKYLEKNKISILWLTAPLFNQLSENNPKMFKNIRVLLTGGDVLSPKHINNVIDNCPNLTIINGYGPTENTTFSTCFTINKKYKTSIPIGFPISNSTCYVVSPNMKLVPIGTYGELLVGGDGVSLGYLNKPNYTKERFIPNIFGEGTLYKTGDLVKWNEDGSIEFSGRIDHQVKIRGFRVELGEITLKIQKFPDIKECVTVVKNINNQKVLCSYISSDVQIDINELKNYLKTTLPTYSIPTYFVQLNIFPINANGKIDLKKLPEPINTNIEKGIIASRNSTDKKLINILKDILNIDKISISDSFLDLGGDSLSAINLSAKIQSEFDVEIFVKDILNNPIVSEISDTISLKLLQGAKDKKDKKTITKVPKLDVYPTFSSQKNMYYATKLDGENSILYNVPGGVIFDKTPNIKKLENCFRELISRHESFRTYFDIENDTIVQKILDNVNFNLEIQKEPISFNDLDNEFKTFVKPFDFSKPPLLHSKLLKLDDGRAVLFVDMHHIISDGASISIFINELSKLYNGENLEKIKFTYKDFAYFENEVLSSDKFIDSENYWVNSLSGDLPILNMPTNYNRPTIKSYDGSNVYSSIDEDNLLKIENICKKLSITPYMLLLGVYYILLSKYTSQDDIIVGSPIANRTTTEFSNVIGMFVNTLPYRMKIDSSFSFKEFLLNLKDICLENYKHQEYPLTSLISKLKLQRDSSRSPLFDTLFVYQNNGLTDLSFDNIKSEFFTPTNKVSKYDLTLEVIPQNDNTLKLNFEYCTKLFTKQFIESFSNHYKNILNIILDNIDTKISSICVLSEREKNKILYEFNNTKADYPKDKTISELFEEQVLKTPNNIALVFENKTLTYKQLNEKSNQLARFLRNNGITKGDIIGIMTSVSLETVISMLAVLKAGSAYVLIDNNLPNDRIEYILESSKAKALISKNTFNKNLSFENIIDIEKVNFNKNKENISNQNTSQDVFALIYTSGSTGLPKGVLLSHFGFINTIYNYIEILELNKYNTHLNICNISFDIFSLETFISLLIGKKLILANEEEQKNPILMNNLMLKNNVDFFMTTPSKMNLLLLNDTTRACLKNLKAFLLGGEIFPKSLYNDLVKYTDAKMFNGYGPTEVSACCSIKEIKDENINIGKPMFNTNILVLDKDMNLCPINVPGEIYVSGNGVSYGYINNPSATQKAFKTINNTVLYKTGDLGYFTKSGELEYIGRNDFQIKLHGLRIELSEIDNVIMSINEISKSVTICDNQKLISFFISNTHNLDINFIKETISKKLPTYMVPVKFIRVNEFPMSANGKVDLKALTKMVSFDEEEKNIIMPKNEIEQKLYDIFCNLLDMKNISTDESFFNLGGDSLSAIKLVVEIYNTFNKDITIKDVFNHSTILELYNIIVSNNTSVSENYVIKKVNKLPYYNLSETQKNIYYATKLDGENSILYNVPGGVIFDKTPNIKKLENCFRELISRHESFRTYFDIENDTIVQKILDNVNFNLEIQKEPISFNDLDNEFKTFVKPFDFSKPPLLHSKLLKLDDGRAVLFVDMHHIISDGASISIFINELSKLYNGENLEKIKFTYKDFAYFENEVLSSDKFIDSENYWVNSLSGDLPILNMPTNYNRPTIKSYDGSNVYSSIDEDNLLKIENICKKLSITPYMLLLGVYYILLSKYTSQDDIIVGSPIANRTTTEFSNVIGMFVNTLPYRMKIDSSFSFKEFLLNLKDICLENYKHQEYPLTSLISKLKLQRDSSRSPLFDTLFVYQNNGLTDLSFDNIKSEFFTPTNKVSKYDLTLEVIPQNDNTLKLNFEYCTKLFTKQFIESFSNHYKNILNIILDNIDTKISSICVLSEREKNKILYEFNNTKADYPKDKTISELFEEQVLKTPNNIALVFENKTLTYKQLNEKSNQLARFLRNNGITRGDIVGIMVNRSLEMIISILAVLKSGATYIPIDPEYPEDRIKYMLDNSNSKILLTFEDLADKVSYENKVFVELSDKKIYSTLSKNNLENINEPNDFSYIIYTSGSTGKPKGVVLKHKSLTNLQSFLKNNFEFFQGKAQKTVVSVTTVSFDIFIFETIFSLTAGLKLVICNEEEQYMPQNLYNLLEKYNVDMIQMTPSRMRIFLENLDIKKLSKIKYVVLAGEPLPISLVQRLKELGVKKVYNGYGPSETTVFSTFTDVTDYNTINIGKPLSNSEFYILDNNLLPVPIGVPGELYISGDGVGNGYLNNEEKTASSFIPNPFIENTIMYKTGDICKYLPNSEIDYLERADNQVKIRGLRIELGEIEAKLMSHRSIEKAIVIKQTMNNRDFISAYFTIKKKVNISELRKNLSKYLPKYMVPSYFTVLDDFPYTPNGKINKKALPLPNEILSSSGEEYVAPKTDLQIKLVNMFEQILNISPIGINDNFFELGGDSILAMNLNIELKKLTDKISYSDIFKFPSVSELENKINSNDEEYDFKYLEQNYSKYNELLEKNNKVPKAYELKYKEIGNILLTGSTGFLGMHVLEAFIRNEKGNIYCIIREEPRTFFWT